jgi:hypothetical protein
MSYIEKKIDELFAEQNASMAKGERPNPVTKKLWQECMKKKGEIEGKIENGEISEQGYAEMQKAQYVKDLKLLSHFKSIKDLTKAK